MVEEICQILFRWMFKKKIEREEEDRQEEQLSKQNKDVDDTKDGETSGVAGGELKGKDYGKEDHSYKNLMEYFTDYSYYQKNLVDKAHDDNNKY